MSSLMANVQHWRSPMSQLDGISMIDHLFNRFDGMYPNVFKANFKNHDAMENWKNAWAEGFIEDGVTLQEIKGGLVYSRREYDYPPSYAKFLKACRYCDYETLFIEAVKGHGKRAHNEKYDFKYPVSYFAGVRFGVYDMRNSVYKDVKERWKNCVDTVMRKGFGEVPEVLPALSHEHIKADPENVKKVMGCVSEVLGKQPKGVKHWLNVASKKDLPFISYKLAAEGLQGLGHPIPEELLSKLGIEA